MNFFLPEQIAGIILFFLGGWVLSLCSKWEREERERLKDPRVRHLRKVDFVKPQTRRGTLMTLAGSLISLSGMILFLSYVGGP